eukprot:566766-Amphidinium_carterae.1
MVVYALKFKHESRKLRRLMPLKHFDALHHSPQRLRLHLHLYRALVLVPLVQSVITAVVKFLNDY